MKYVLTLIAFFSVQSAALAKISNSTLSQQHQSLIESAVVKSCVNLYNYRLAQISNKVETVNVDNGIVDEYFTTTLLLTTRLDQITEETIVTVESVISDSYDHNTKDWGALSVLSVEGCQK